MQVIEWSTYKGPFGIRTSEERVALLRWTVERAGTQARKSIVNTLIERAYEITWGPSATTAGAERTRRGVDTS
jgi:hypothetical protein